PPARADFFLHSENASYSCSEARRRRAAAGPPPTSNPPRRYTRGADGGPYTMAAPNATHANGTDALHEVEQLRSEDEGRRNLVLELEQALQGATGGEQDFEARARAYESLLEEKSEVIRDLHVKVQALEKELDAQAEAKAERRPSGPVPREEELMMLSEELE